MSTNESIYPMWLTQEHVYIADMNQARDIEYKYLIRAKDCSSEWEDKKHPAAKRPENKDLCENRKVDVSHFAGAIKIIMRKIMRGSLYFPYSTRLM